MIAERNTSHRLSRKIILYSISGILVLAGLTSHLARRLTLTGDEPRYLLYALSLNLEHKSVMSDEGYESFRARPLPRLKVTPYAIADIQGGSKIPAHSIVTSLVLAPFITSFPLQQVRLVALFAGLAGLIFLTRFFIAENVSTAAALACLAPAAFCLPAVSYYFMALPEIFLFLLVACAFANILLVDSQRLRDFWPAVTCSCLAPLVHLRGAALFVTIAAYLAIKLGWRKGLSFSWKPILAIAGVYLAAAAACLAYNALVYDNILGSANTARPTIRVGNIVELFLNWRHGLLTYTPLYLLSFVGLIAGFRSRRPWAIPAALFLSLVVLASAGPDPGECIPGRFWVQAAPVLSICLLGFMQGRLPPVLKATIYGLLASVAVANTILFFIHPDAYLAARSGAFPYIRLFESIPGVYLGFWVDLFHHAIYQYSALWFVLLSVLILSVASIYRSRVFAAAGVAFIVAGFELHRAVPVEKTVKLERQVLEIGFNDAAVPKSAILRIDMRPLWKSDCPPRVVSVWDGTTSSEQVVKSSVIVQKSADANAPFNLRISWDSPETYVTDPGDIRVIVNQSWLVRLFAGLLLPRGHTAPL